MDEYIVRETDCGLATKQEIVGELVRCKECKWWIPHGKETPASIPALGECRFMGGKFPTACFEFCYWGERKDDEHTD